MGEKVVVVVVDLIRKVGLTRLHLSLDPLFVRHAPHPIHPIQTSSTNTIAIHPHPNQTPLKIHSSPHQRVHRTHPRTSTPTHA